VNAGPAERWRIVLGLVVLAAGGFLLLRGAAGSLLRALVPEAPNTPRSEVVAIPEGAGSGMRSPSGQEKEEEASAGGVVVSGEFRNDPFAPIPGQPGTRDVTAERQGAAVREGEGRGQAGVPSSPAAQLPPPPPLQEVPGRVPAAEHPGSEPVREEPRGASGPAPVPQGDRQVRGEGTGGAAPSPSPAPRKPQVSVNAVVGGPWQYVAMVSHGGTTSWVSEGDLLGGWMVRRISQGELVLEDVKTGERITVRAEAPADRQEEKGHAAPSPKPRGRAR
jgi:hypothetical protein